MSFKSTYTLGNFLNRPDSVHGNDRTVWIYGAFIAMTLISFERLIAIIFGVPYLNSISHLVLLVFAAIVMQDMGRGVVHRCALNLLVLLFLLILMSAVSNYFRGFLVTALAVGLQLKLFYMLVIMSKMSLDDLERPIQIFSIIHLAGALANLVFPTFFISLGGNDLWEGGRIIGFQLNPNAFAFASAVLAFYYIFVRRNIPVVMILVVSVFVSGSRSGMLLLFLGLMYLASVRGKLQGKLLGLAGLAIAAIAAFTFEDRFLQTFSNVQSTIEGGGNYIRALILIGGITLASDHFPIGTGAGTYASPLAGNSPTYNDLGLSYLRSFIDASGINDSGLGTMLGEYGVLGVLIIFLFCYRTVFAFGRGILSHADAFMFSILLFVVNVFRNAIASYYYSGVLLLLLLILISLRSRSTSPPN